MPTSRVFCDCSKVCVDCCLTGGMDRALRTTDFILMSGPPKSREEKKLERLRREVERKK